MGRIADLLGDGTAETVRKGIRQDEIDSGSWAGQTGQESDAMCEPRGENTELQRASATLNAVSVFYAAETRPAHSVVVEVHQRPPI